ncbi:DNA-binding transcriptional regulator, GntR family [Paramicrobacterium humi]|uniref:DNA-binding transcriptional regulator, GntR family n=1 Tax=Paramicrobacterium humi TaxID=640635 RepID=A0A1H4KTT9_9MICO|nr:GntR family transcriptional regulator [Microbacterium humi]SEB61954.1 DNA-binding transcriptional regulator, GntR family [Microbacterium humi]
MPDLILNADAAPDGAPAVQRAYLPVATAIVTGDLAAGTMITEGEVSTILGMSRTPVREAFLLLEARGLLRLYPKKGALVTAIDDAEVRDLLEARIMLESTAARTAADRGDTARLGSELARLLDEQRRAAASDDLLAFAHADHLFHARVVEEARNGVFDEIYDSLGPRFERVTHRIVARDAARLAEFISQHEQLAQLIATGRSHEYEPALRTHVMPLG